MRIGWLVAGVVLLVIGAVMLFVPLVPQGSQTVQASSSAPFYAGNVSGFSLTGNIPVSVSWTATTGVEVVAAACSAQCDSGNIASLSDLTIQNGTSGSFTLNQPNGGSIIMGIATSSSGGAQATFKVTTALSTVGTILVVVGIVLVIVGVVLRSKKARAAAVEPSATEQPASVEPSAESGTYPLEPPASPPGS